MPPRRKRKLAIVAVLPLYPPGSRVGAWLATHGFLAHLATRGHRVKVTTYIGNRDAYELDGVTVLPRTTPADDFFDGADVVISHLGDNGVAVDEAANRGLRLVRMAHGSNPENLARLQAAPPDLVVFNSHSLAAEVGWDGPQVVAHPPVDVAAHATKPGRKVTLVNLSADKGGGLFWHLARTMPHVSFLGVRGGYGLQVSDKAKNATVIAATDDMPRDVWRRTGVLLMPSKHETWGMVGLEAMASGIPVIAHPTPGLRESLGDAGWFVDRCDLDGWQRAVEHLQRPSAWQEASQRALAHAAAFDRQAQLDTFTRAMEAL